MLSLLTRRRASSQPVPSRPAPLRLEPDDTDLSAYAALLDETGADRGHLNVALFRRLLADHDLPVFDRTAVVAYMDHLANLPRPDGRGWVWRPLRSVDAAGPTDRRFGDQFTRVLSDVYRTERLYPHPVPAHVLDKVALVGREFTSRLPPPTGSLPLVRFFVSDLATFRDVSPPGDPFLLAVVTNPLLTDGRTGHFVIDVWDEPGFGLTERLG